MLVLLAKITFWAIVAPYALYGLAWGLAAAFPRGGRL